MAFGFGRLRLSSTGFWALTPRELAAAFEAHMPRQGGAPDRAALDALMRAHPDRSAGVDERYSHG